MTIIEAPADLELVNIALEHLHPADDNPRHDLGDVTELAASIASIGILQPLVVVERHVGGGYTIVAGHRRHAAAKVAGAATVPCLVRTMTVEQRQTAMLVENLQRRDLDPLDEATGFQHLVDLGLSQRAIAEQVGCNQSHVSRRLTLTKLPDKAVELVRSGTIQLRTAEQLVDVDDADIDDVFATAVKKASYELENGKAMPDWAVESAVTELARKRKHAAALAAGKASKLKRITDDPRYGYGGFEKCKKGEATHWYLANNDQSITWARAKAAGESSAERPKDEWQIRRDRDDAVEAERDGLLASLLQADQSIVVATGMKVLAGRLRSGDHVNLGAGGLFHLLGIADEPEGSVVIEDDDTLIAAVVLSCMARPGYNGDTELQATVWAGLTSIDERLPSTDAAGIDEVDEPEPPAAEVVQEPEAPQVDGPTAADEFWDPVEPPKRPWPTYDGNDERLIRKMVSNFTVPASIHEVIAYETANANRAPVLEMCEATLAKLAG